MIIEPSMHRPQFSIYAGDPTEFEDFFIPYGDDEEPAVVQFSGDTNQQYADQDAPNYDYRLLFQTENIDRFANQILNLWVKNLSTTDHAIHIQPRILLDFNVVTWELKVAVHPHLELNPDPDTLAYLTTVGADGKRQFKSLNELLNVVFKVEAVVEA